MIEVERTGRWKWEMETPERTDMSDRFCSAWPCKIPVIQHSVQIIQLAIQLPLGELRFYWIQWNNMGMQLIWCSSVLLAIQPHPSSPNNAILLIQPVEINAHTNKVGEHSACSIPPPILITINNKWFHPIKELNNQNTIKYNI